MHSNQPRLARVDTACSVGLGLGAVCSVDLRPAGVGTTCDVSLALLMGLVHCMQPAVYGST